MFLPDYMFDTVYDVPKELFTEHGIKYLLSDIDNTLVPYETEKPTEENLKWFKLLSDMGIKIFFVSNNNSDRIDKYNTDLGFKYIARAGKPKINKYKRLLAENGIDLKQTAVIGDQIFTDIVAGKRLGCVCILVKPINDKKSLFFRFKRACEKPLINRFLRKQEKSQE